MNNEPVDQIVRTLTFQFLEDQVVLHGEVLPRSLLSRGFDFRERRVPLVGPQGIFKPAVLPELPLTITTAPPVRGKEPPYRDELGEDGLLRYRYRGSNPEHHENVGLRRAMMDRVPLVYFHGIVRGHYMPFWPVYIVGDQPERLSFSVAVDDVRIPNVGVESEQSGAREGRRAYVTTLAVRRLHQQSFRVRVLRAYREACAVCRLRHLELLDATHILPDTHPRGEPIVSNGIAMCKLHHAAYDRNILGIRPDFSIEIRTDILEEIDGPMLVHGLQEFDGRGLSVPRPADLKPNPDFLAERYSAFQRAG